MEFRQALKRDDVPLSSSGGCLKKSGLPDSEAGDGASQWISTNWPNVREKRDASEQGKAFRSFTTDKLAEGCPRIRWHRWLAYQPSGSVVVVLASLRR